MTKVFCPVCAASHKMAKNGCLPRHGFAAKNVRHGQTGGFHIGGHGGEQPIGTTAGNELALKVALRHDATAANLRALPPSTIEAARENALDEVYEMEMRNWRHRAYWGKASKDVPARPTVEQVTTGSDYLSVRGWFSERALQGRASRMDSHLRNEAEAHTQHAATLRQLVAEHPAG